MTSTNNKQLTPPRGSAEQCSVYFDAYPEYIRFSTTAEYPEIVSRVHYEPFFEYNLVTQCYELIFMRRLVWKLPTGFSACVEYLNADRSIHRTVPVQPPDWCNLVNTPEDNPPTRASALTSALPVIAEEEQESSDPVAAAVPPPSEDFELLPSYLEKLFDSTMAGIEHQSIPGYERLTNAFNGVFFGASAPGGDSKIQAAIEKSRKELAKSNLSPLEAFRWTVANWSKLADSPICSHVENLLGCAIVLGFLPPESSEVKVNAVTIFQTTQHLKYKNMLSLLDGFIGALNFFVESAVAAWETNDLSAFLYEKSTSSKLDEIYSWIATRVPQLKSGLLEKEEPGGVALMHARLEHAIQTYTLAVQCAKPGTLNHRIYQKRLVEFQEVRILLVQQIKKGKLVKQPYCIIYYGAPRCGKSGIIKATIHVAAGTLNTTIEDSQIATLLPDDKYDSQVTNSTKVVILDDIANRPIKFDPSLGLAQLLALVNNIPYVANKAEIEAKGTTLPELILVCGSTNNLHMNADVLSVKSDSLKMRYAQAIVEVKPEYAVGESFSQDLFDQNPKYVTFGGMRLKDAHKISTHQFVDGSWRFDHYMIGDTKRYCDSLNIAEHLAYIEWKVADHDRRQTSYLAEQNSLVFKKCTKCNRYTCVCSDSDSENDSESPVDVSELIDMGGGLFIPDGQPGDSPSSNGESADNSADSSGSHPLLVEPADDPSDSEDGEERQGKPPPTAKRRKRPPGKNSPKKGKAKKFLAKEDQSFMPLTMRALRQTTISAAKQWLGDLPMATRVARFLGLQLFNNADPLVSNCTHCLVSYVTHADWFQWWFWIPDEIFENWTIVRLLAPIMMDTRLRFQIQVTNLILLIALFISVITVWYNPYLSFGSFIIFVYASMYAYLLRHSAYQIIANRREACSEIGDTYRQNYGVYVRNALAIIAVLTAASFVWTMWNNAEFAGDPKALVKENQGFFTHDTEKDLVAKDATPNEWEKDVVVKNVKLTPNPNQTSTQLVNLCLKNQSIAYRSEGKDANGKETWQMISRITWLRTNIGFMPAHAIPTTNERWLIQDNEKSGSSQPITVGPSNFRKKKGTDTAFFYAVTRDRSDLIKYLPKVAQHGGQFAQLVCKDDNFKPLTHEESPIRCRNCPATVGDLSFDSWSLEFETWKGMCSATYVSMNKNPFIVGFHVGAVKEDKKTALSEIVTQADALTAIASFRSDMNKIFPGATPDEMKSDVCGTQIFDPTAQEPFQPLSEQVEYLRMEQQGADFMGFRSTQAYYKSNVVPTPIHETVSEKFPESKEYAGPKFGRSMWPKSAMFSFHTSPGVPDGHLIWATQDYLTVFDDIPEYLKNDLKPLTNKENVNGVDGKKFLDAINAGTSMGLGFRGKKREHITEHYDAEYERILRDFPEEIWKEVDQCVDRLKAGERNWWCYNAVPKDEVTPVDKEKVRLFQVSSVVASLVVRRYFTPVIRVLHMLASKSECGVGMNCTSADWEELQTHLEQFDNKFDGDYSKYDLRMAASLMAAAFRILIVIASRSEKYSEEDLFVMEQLASDMIFPLVNFNGQVYNVWGSNPSGHPLTVDVNSIVNSLLLRCGYVEQYPNSGIGSFRRYVSVGTYGDDFNATVSYWRSRFNFITLQKFLNEHDIKLTPGVKTAEGKKFLPKSENMIFLQRRTSQLPGVPFRVGALNEESILKSLKATIPSKDMSLEVQCSINIDNALREWFFHGEEIYEARRATMKQVAKEHDLQGLCTQLELPFDQALDAFKEKNAILRT